MSTGCKGYVYKGYCVRYVWDGRRGCWAYEVVNPARPEAARVTFSQSAQARAFIDKMERNHGRERQG